MSTNKQWWEAQWKNIYDLPATARIALRYQNLEDAKKAWGESRNSDAEFYARYCKPSHCLLYTSDAADE